LFLVRRSLGRCDFIAGAFFAVGGRFGPGKLVLCCTLVSSGYGSTAFLASGAGVVGVDIVGPGVVGSGTVGVGTAGGKWVLLGIVLKIGAGVVGVGIVEAGVVGSGAVGAGIALYLSIKTVPVQRLQRV
jgi:hypothetical protein